MNMYDRAKTSFGMELHSRRNMIRLLSIMRVCPFRNYLILLVFILDICPFGVKTTIFLSHIVLIYSVGILDFIKIFQVT